MYYQCNATPLRAVTDERLRWSCVVSALTWSEDPSQSYGTILNDTVD